MQDIFEKIKDRFMKVGNIQFSNYTKPLITVEDAIKIVNQVAEEYVPDINVGSNDGWIPTSERMPKENTEVLIARQKNKHEICMGYYNKDFGWYDQCYNHMVSDVLAWRVLPEPYKPKGEK